MSQPDHSTHGAMGSERDKMRAPESAASAGAERFEVQVNDAVTGEVLGYGSGDTPEEAFDRAMEEVDVSGKMPDTPDENLKTAGA